VLSAIGQQAAVTTLVTNEGRSLTEVKLTLRNHAQPFLKVELPAGASILSVEVAGEKVKPVEGADGSRVPLLRPGFRPTGPYGISFVFLHSGTPFAKKGGAELTLPKMDVPIGRLEWEVFAPERYRLANFGGDAIREYLFPQPGGDSAAEPAALPVPGAVNVGALGPGEIGGIVTDPAGAVVAHASVSVLHLATRIVSRTFTDALGRWSVANVPSGSVRISIEAPGFKLVMEASYNSSRGMQRDAMLEVGNASESV
jgi:hypothetical protein